MLKISRAACPCLSQLISAQFAFEMCLAAQNRQKIHKTPILAFKVIQDHWIWCQSKTSVRLFIIVMISNLGLISHSYWDTATWWLKSQIFPTPSYLALSFGVTPFEFIKKALRFLKLESSMQLTVKIWWSCTVFDLTTRVTDGQTELR